MKEVVVASLNPVKVNAVQQAFAHMFSDQEFNFLTVSGDSGVPDQPMSDSEALDGALNRALAAATTVPTADFHVGVEGGIEDSTIGMAAFAWIVVLSSGVRGQGRTATFFLPDRVADLVRSGMELGKADDIVFARENSKQSDGAIGLLTGNVIDRTALYEQGVVMALIPFRNGALFARTLEE